MKRGDISDTEVCIAYKESKLLANWPYEILAKKTGAAEKVCFRAMERAFDRGYVEYGVSLRSGWLTEKGKQLIKEKFE